MGNLAWGSGTPSNHPSEPSNWREADFERFPLLSPWFPNPKRETQHSCRCSGNENWNDPPFSPCVLSFSAGIPRFLPFSHSLSALRVVSFEGIPILIRTSNMATQPPPQSPKPPNPQNPKATPRPASTQRPAGPELLRGAEEGRAGPRPRRLGALARQPRSLGRLRRPKGKNIKSGVCATLKWNVGVVFSWFFFCGCPLFCCLCFFSGGRLLCLESTRVFVEGAFLFGSKSPRQAGPLCSSLFSVVLAICGLPLNPTKICQGFRGTCSDFQLRSSQ